MIRLWSSPSLDASDIFNTLPYFCSFCCIERGEISRSCMVFPSFPVKLPRGLPTAPLGLVASSAPSGSTRTRELGQLERAVGPTLSQNLSEIFR